jgi:hypothetical protein
VGEHNKLQKRSTALIRENVQYVLAFSVIAGMLMFTGLPVFVVFFFGILGYFIWKTLSSPTASGTREIFEFYLVANEILRDDERRWYGFEIQDAIARGENILVHMSGAPPLVSFALGALYNKIGDHTSAVAKLEYVVDSESSDETRFVYPSPELRSYVKTLRKIEREPAEAPLMSSAIRALERARRSRAKILLDSSRASLDEEAIRRAEAEVEAAPDRQLSGSELAPKSFIDPHLPTLKQEFDAHYQDAERQSLTEKPRSPRPRRKKDLSAADPASGRQTISEVLRDIYDAKT